MQIDLNNLKDLKNKIQTVIKRYNMLVEGLESFEKELTKKVATIEDFEIQVKNIVHNTNLEVKNHAKLVGELEKRKKIMAHEFKTIVKKEQMLRLENRLNRVNYENLITKDQFKRMLNEI